MTKWRIDPSLVELFDGPGLILHPVAEHVECQVPRRIYRSGAKKMVEQFVKNGEAKFFDTSLTWVIKWWAEVHGRQIETEECELGFKIKLIDQRGRPSLRSRP